MLPDVREAFLDDAEDLDLLVRSELDAGIDLQLDGELAVGGQDVEVTTERGVERRVAAGRRERQDREARLLLSERSDILQPLHGAVGRSATLEHRGVGRDRE